MFALAILIGIYSYLIFCLGILGFLYRAPVLLVTLFFISGSVMYFYKNKEDILKINLRNKKIRPLLIIFVVMVFINLNGALGPELSFDALWYHLTIPKIFIQNHKIFFIEGNLFYYSLLPKLGEMLFIPSLMFGNETVAKLIQWLLGILTSIVVYKISRRYFDEKVSFFAVLIFYSNLVVSWESTVAYVDLIRTFFEAMGLWGFLNWYETRDRKWLIESAVMIGFALSSKILAFGSISIFFLLFCIFENKKSLALKNALTFSVIAVLTALPWFIFSFIQSGNPIYPTFSLKIIDSFSAHLNPLYMPLELLNLFVKSADPISPIYLILLPLVFLYFKKLNIELKIITVYTLLALLIWFITPRLGGGRLILPYLPAFSVLSIGLISQIKNIPLKRYLYTLILIICLITIFYRGIANSRYTPVIIGLESKKEFLTNNLNFNFGDFYDTDDFFKKTIQKEDKVLMYGFHNIYYTNFPFIHSSYAKPGDRFNYLVTQNADLPQRFSYWELIYVNDKTDVKVYTQGGQMWSY
jgi:4-amino-4-deoxy-L-arabinose transferase-like glycosyltransferase